MGESTKPLSSRVAIVTGGSSGIGISIAKLLAANGARVMVVGRNEKRLDAVVSDIEEAGGTAAAISVDLCSDDAPSQVVDQTLKAFGRIDSLVNSAGIYLETRFLDCPIENVDKQYEINVRAPFALTQAVVQHMPKGSSVVFVSSIAARCGFAATSAYSATKGAINSLSRVLSVELAPIGISVNTVSPGWIASPMNEAIRENQAVVDAAISITPAGRLGTPEDVAPAVLYLVSPDSHFTQGANIEVGGGYPNVS